MKEEETVELPEDEPTCGRSRTRCPDQKQMRQDAEFRSLEAASDRAGALATKPEAVHYKPACKAAAERPVRNEP